MFDFRSRCDVEEIRCCKFIEEIHFVVCNWLLLEKKVSTASPRCRLWHEKSSFADVDSRFKFHRQFVYSSRRTLNKSLLFFFHFLLGLLPKHFEFHELFLSFSCLKSILASQIFQYILWNIFMSLSVGEAALCHFDTDCKRESLLRFYVISGRSFDFNSFAETR